MREAGSEMGVVASQIEVFEGFKAGLRGKMLCASLRKGDQTSDRNENEVKEVEWKVVVVD